jgi:hypothetical protein
MSQSPAWLLLINSVSGENKTARMRIWRALKASGAGTPRDGVYVLPNSEAARTVFREQAAEVVDAGGSAHIVSFDSEDEAQHDQFVQLFDRGGDYAELIRRLKALKSSIPKLDEIEARRQLGTLRRDVAAIVAVDFFPGPSRAQADVALADVEAAINARFSPDEPHAAKGAIPLRERSRYRARTWATRERLWIDRVASAWLIRRFIDPKAKFLWLKKPKDCPKTAVGFDFDGAEFTHVGARVTFEVLAASFGLDTDAAITRIGALVHYLDVGGIPVPEASGFAAIMTGARAQKFSDDKLLQNMSTVLDALYLGFTDAPENSS